MRFWRVPTIADLSFFSSVAFSFCSTSSASRYGTHLKKLRLTPFKVLDPKKLMLVVDDNCFLSSLVKNKLSDEKSLLNEVRASELSDLIECNVFLCWP